MDTTRERMRFLLTFLFCIVALALVYATATILVANEAAFAAAADAVSSSERSAVHPTLAYTVDIVVGHDVYFRPQPLHHDISEVVGVLANNYGANTLYVVYAGQQSFDDAVILFMLWDRIAKQYDVRMIPVVSLVNNTFGMEHPEYVLGPIDRSGLGMIMDPRKPEVIAAYRDFVGKLESAIHPEVIGIFEFNDYSIARSVGTIPNLPDQVLANWIQELARETKARLAMTFQQPWGVGLPWLDGIEKISLDTYGFLRDAQWDALDAYCRRSVSFYREVDADLIILDDYGGKLEGWRQRKAAEVFQRAGVTGLNMDLMIISAVAWDQKGEDFWRDLLDDGRYDGFYADAFDEVVEIYREWAGGRKSES